MEQHAQYTQRNEKHIGKARSQIAIDSLLDILQVTLIDVIAAVADFSVLKSLLQTIILDTQNQ